MVYSYEVNEQIGCQIAAGHDHMARQFPDAERLPPRRVHFRIGIARRGDAIRRSVCGAYEAISNVKSIRQAEFTRLSRRKYRRKHADLDGTGGMVVLIATKRMRLCPGIVVDGNGNGLGRQSGDVLLEVGVEHEKLNAAHR